MPRQSQGFLLEAGGLRVGWAHAASVTRLIVPVQDSLALLSRKCGCDVRALTCGIREWQRRMPVMGRSRFNGRNEPQALGRDGWHAATAAAGGARPCSRAGPGIFRRSGCLGRHGCTIETAAVIQASSCGWGPLPTTMLRSQRRTRSRSQRRSSMHGAPRGRQQSAWRPDRQCCRRC